MTTDTELLRQYARQGQEAAFTEVVHRYTDLVYSASLRMVAGDAHLAHDVAQRVFSALAAQADALSHRPNIVGWLYTTTHHSASVVVRTEQRRRAREQIAFTMSEEPTRNEIDWSQLQPLLDEEVCRLGQADREAVLLRFFQGKSHREVGEALGVSEDLARKRVERAIEKLRTSFSRRGFGISSALLAETIAGNSVQAAPAGLAASLASLTLANTGKAALLVPVWKTFLIAMKTKIIVITSVVALGLIIAGAWHWSQPDSQNPEKAGFTGANRTAATSGTNPIAANQNPAAGTLHGNRVVAPALPAVVASASSSGTVTAATYPSADLSTTMRDVVRLVAAKDYETLMLNYLPAKTRTALGVPTGTTLTLNDDLKIQQLFQTYADLITAASNTPPVFSADGRSARLRATPNADSTVVFAMLDGSWRIAGIEKSMPGAPESTGASAAAPVKKANAQTGGGYVP